MQVMKNWDVEETQEFLKNNAKVPDRYLEKFRESSFTGSDLYKFYKELKALKEDFVSIPGNILRRIVEQRENVLKQRSDGQQHYQTLDRTEANADFTSPSANNTNVSSKTQSTNVAQHKPYDYASNKGPMINETDINAFLKTLLGTIVVETAPDRNYWDANLFELCSSKIDMFRNHAFYVLWVYGSISTPQITEKIQLYSLIKEYLSKNESQFYEGNDSSTKQLWSKDVQMRFFKDTKKADSRQGKKINLFIDDKVFDIPHVKIHLTQNESHPVFRYVTTADINKQKCELLQLNEQNKNPETVCDSKTEKCASSSSNLPAQVPDNAKSSDADIPPRPFLQSDMSKIIPYKQGKVLDALERGSTGDFITPVHEFKHHNQHEDGLINTIVDETLMFACGCLNSRINGTIHFGIQEKENRGIVTGISLNDETCKAVATKLAKGYQRFSPHVQTPGTLNMHTLIHQPTCIKVVPEKSKLIVLEIDVEPRASICNNTVYKYNRDIFQRISPDKTENVSRTSLKENLAEEWKFVDGVANRNDLRRQKEEEYRGNNVDKIILDDARFTDLFCLGAPENIKNMYPVLVVSSCTNASNQLSCLSLIDWTFVLDFDCLTDADIQSTVLNLYQKEDRNITIKSAAELAVEGINDRCSTYWIRCNDEKAKSGNSWYDKYGQNVSKTITKIREHLLPGDDCTREANLYRIRILLLLVSHDDIDLLADIIFRKLGENFTISCLTVACICESKALFDAFKRAIYQKNSFMFKSQECLNGICIYLPLVHFSNLLHHKFGQCPKTMLKEIPTPFKIAIKIKEKDHALMNLLDILGSNECCEAIDEKKQYWERISYYNGSNNATWINFASENHICKRDILPELLKKIEIVRTAKRNNTVEIINIFHQPGAGATTVAKHALWENRKKLRCATLNNTDSDTCAAKQLYYLYEYGETEEYPSRRRIPVLVIVDNLKSDRLKRALEDECRRREIRRDSEPAFILLIVYCCEEYEISERRLDPFVVLKHALSSKEMWWFVKVQKDMEAKNQILEQSKIISLLVMRENFNLTKLEYIVGRLVFNIKNEKEIRLIKYMALLTKYAHNFRYLQISQCQNLFSTKMYENNLTESIKTLVITKTQCFKLRHPKLADIILKVFKGEIEVNDTYYETIHTLYDIAYEFIACKKLLPIRNDERGRWTEESLHNKAVVMLKRVTDNPYPSLIMDILSTSNNEHTVRNNAIKLLDAALEAFNDAYLAEHICRLYTDSGDFEKAKQYIEKAIKLSSVKSIFHNSYGMIFQSEMTENIKSFSDNLKPSYQEGNLLEINTADPNTINKTRHIFELYDKAQMQFKEAQCINKKEKWHDHEIYLNELDTVFELICIISNVIKIHTKGDKTFHDYFYEDDDAQYKKILDEQWPEIRDWVKNVRERVPISLECLCKHTDEQDYMGININNKITLSCSKYCKYFLISEAHCPRLLEEDEWHRRVAETHYKAHGFKAIFKLLEEAREGGELSQLQKVHSRLCKIANQTEVDKLKLLYIKLAIYMFNRQKNRTDDPLLQTDDQCSEKNIESYVRNLISTKSDYYRKPCYLIWIMINWSKSWTDDATFKILNEYTSYLGDQFRKHMDIAKSHKQQGNGQSQFNTNLSIPCEFFLGKDNGIASILHRPEIYPLGKYVIRNNVKPTSEMRSKCQEVECRFKDRTTVIYSKDGKDIEILLMKPIDICGSQTLKAFIGFSWAGPVAYVTQLCDDVRKRPESC